MAPPPTPEQAAAHLRELPLNSPIIEIFINGIYTCLFVFSIGAVWMTPKASHRKKVWLGIIIVLYSCATIHSAIQWEDIVLAFQNHGTSPDLLTALTHPNLKLKILALGASFLSFILADMIMIWRCYIIWGHSWIVIVIPILAAVAGTVCASLGLAGQIAVASVQDSTHALRFAPLLRFSTPFLSLSLAVTLYTTGLITWRILNVQRYATKNGLTASDFSPVLEILIESSALYAASLFVFVVLLAMKSTNETYLQNIHAQIAGIAPTLLILRISVGHARKDEEWSAPSSSLRFAGTPGEEVKRDSMIDEYSSGDSSNSVREARGGRD